MHPSVLSHVAQQLPTVGDALTDVRKLPCSSWSAVDAKPSHPDAGGGLGGGGGDGAAGGDGDAGGGKGSMYAITPEPGLLCGRASEPLR